MILLMLAPTCIFFILNFSINVSAGITENLFFNPDLNMAMQKIEELHTIVRKQGEILEQRTIESQNTAKQQSDIIARLEARIQELEIGVKTQNYPVKALSSETEFLTPFKSFIKKGILFFILLYCNSFQVHGKVSVIDVLLNSRQFLLFRVSIKMM